MKTFRTRSLENENNIMKTWLINVYNFYGEFERGTELKAKDWKEAWLAARLWIEKENIQPLHYDDGVYVDFSYDLK